MRRFNSVPRRKENIIRRGDGPVAFTNEHGPSVVKSSSGSVNGQFHSFEDSNDCGSIIKNNNDDDKASSKPKLEDQKNTSRKSTDDGSSISDKDDAMALLVLSKGQPAKKPSTTVITDDPNFPQVETNHVKRASLAKRVSNHCGEGGRDVTIACSTNYSKPSDGDDTVIEDKKLNGTCYTSSGSSSSARTFKDLRRVSSMATPLDTHDNVECNGQVPHTNQNIVDSKCKAQKSKDDLAIRTKVPTSAKGSLMNIRRHVSLNPNLLRRESPQSAESQIKGQSTRFNEDIPCTQEEEAQSLVAGERMIESNNRHHTEYVKKFIRPGKSTTAKPVMLRKFASASAQSCSTNSLQAHTSERVSLFDLFKSKVNETRFKYPLDYALGVAVRYHVLLPCAGDKIGTRDEALCVSVIKNLFHGDLFVTELAAMQPANSCDDSKLVIPRAENSEIFTRLVLAKVEQCCRSDSLTLAQWYRFKGDKFLSYSSPKWSEYWERKCRSPDVGCEMIKLMTNTSQKQLLAVAYIERSVNDNLTNEPITIIKGIRISPSCNMDALRRSQLNPGISSPTMIIPKFKDVRDIILNAVLLRSLIYGTKGVGVFSEKDEISETFFRRHMGPAISFSEEGRKYFCVRSLSRWRLIREQFQNQLVNSIEMSAVASSMPDSTRKAQDAKSKRSANISGHKPNKNLQTNNKEIVQGTERLKRKSVPNEQEEASIILKKRQSEDIRSSANAQK